MLSTGNQAYVFLSTVYAGFFIGIFYDICRMTRRILRSGRFLTGLIDLSFWLASGVFAYGVVFFVHDGGVRVYMISGFAIGWALYALLLSPYVMGGMEWIFRTVTSVFRFLLKGIMRPFITVLHWVLPPLRRLALIFKKSEKRVEG